MSTASILTPAERIPIALSGEAARINREMLRVLRILISRGGSSCDDVQFSTSYAQLLGLFDEYQREVALRYGRDIACHRGCVWCCYQWVEDVYSFEADCIATFLLSHYDVSTIKQIGSCLYEDCRCVERIYEQVCREKYSDEKESPELDESAETLKRFNDAQRACPLLNVEEGSCMVFKVRPLTCRSYLSSDSRVCGGCFCKASSGAAQGTAAFIIDATEEVNAQLERLHVLHQRFEDDTGLRSLLYQYLTHTR